MTVLFYKVGDYFTKSYFDAKNKSLETNTEMKKCFVEYPYVENISEIIKLDMDKLVDKYNKKEVKFV